MKNLLISAIIIVGVILCVILSSVFVSISLKDIEDSIDEGVKMPESDENFEEIEGRLEALREDFYKKEILLSLLISDRTLEDVKNCFSDVINYAKAKSKDGVLTSVERLHNAIENIRIRAEFSLESIF